MSESQILEKSKQLALKTIDFHNKKKLGSKSLLIFLKEQLKKIYYTEDCNKIIIEYCSFLAKYGYEIMIDTDYFDIIDYNSSKYQEYISSLINKLPKNYDKLKSFAKNAADKMIYMYHSNNYLNKSYQDYINEIMSETKYSTSEKLTIEANIVHFITQNHYDIDSTNPLILSEF